MTIPFACIGYGGSFRMGHIHCTNAGTAGFTPRAVCAPRAEDRALAVADFPGIAVFAEPAAMLAACPEVRLVTIAAPTHVHASLAGLCLDAGRNVVVEKPLAPTVAQLDALAAQAQRSGLVVVAHHNRLFDGRYRKAREVIDGGLIGRPVRAHLAMSVHKDPAKTYDAAYKCTMAGVGGLLFDFGSHMVAWGLALLGDEPTEVSGFSTRGTWSSDPGRIEDELTAVVRTVRGGLLTVRHSHIDPVEDPWLCTVVGTAGTLRFGWAEWELIRPGVPAERGPNPADSWEGFYHELHAHLSAPIGNRPPLTASLTVARQAVQVCELASRSAACGRTLFV